MTYTIVYVVQDETSLPPPVDLRAGRLIRRARYRIAMYQSELAARLGVPQSQISSYERGRRQPSLTALTRMIEATGTELVLTLAPIPRHLLELDTGTDLTVRRSRHDLVAETERAGFLRLRYRPDPAGATARFVVDTLFAAGPSARAALEDRLEKALGMPVSVEIPRRGTPGPADAIALD
jgi:transcriptional regulator with XRE-family HTH domain